MIDERALRRKMPIINTMKIAGAIGFLMQGPAAICCPEVGVPFYASSNSYAFSAMPERQARNLMMNEALGLIRDLTAVVNKGYSILLDSTEEDRDILIGELDPEQTNLIELLLRGLEGALKNAYNECSEKQRHIVKEPLIVVAQARASVVKVNHLIGQMTNPVETFVSNIDRDALLALAQHGTKVFTSDSFH